MSMKNERCGRCGQVLGNTPGEPIRDRHWRTRSGYPVCDDIVRPDRLGEPEWDIECVLRELAEAREAIGTHRTGKLAVAWGFGEPPPDEYGDQHDQRLWSVLAVSGPAV